ncbi:cell division protein FtsQ [Spirochaetia bacterium]|nr:cell division protein FtsQ [Spirochaetia bacterium]
MATDYVYDEDSPAVEIHRSSATEKWLKRLIAIVAGVLAAELIWLFIITPMLPLSTVEITGIPGIDQASLLAHAGISAHSSFMTVNALDVETALERLYLVESARVTKHFPDTLYLELEPRRVAAMSLAAVNGKMVPVFFDKHGVVMQIGRDQTDMAAIASLPVISGLVFEQVGLGTRLPPVFMPFLERLEVINAETPELLAAVSEIRINKKPYDGFDLVLYPMNSTIRFRVEAELNEDTLRYMMLMMDVFKLTGARVDEVDLRTGTASYVVKEASSGY